MKSIWYGIQLLLQLNQCNHKDIFELQKLTYLLSYHTTPELYYVREVLLQFLIRALDDEHQLW